MSFLRAGRFSEGFAAVNVGTGEAHKSVADACATGFIDTEGRFTIAPRFLATGTFQDGKCLVETEKSIAYIDRSGHPLWSSGWVQIW